MLRTRFAPSPTGYMHIGNLRTALYEYLIAKHANGQFILRIEDTDQERLVPGAVDVIYETLKITGIKHDEGPDVGGNYGPYVQSERKNMYYEYAMKLIEKGEAYYCFCKKGQDEEKEFDTYQRCCRNLCAEEINTRLANKEPYVIRQKVPLTGESDFYDEVYGLITVQNDKIEDQILLKSDGLPTYNFANVVDDHLMKITHVVRGSEYLSSTPKYNLLYRSFGWEIPKYVHLPPVMKTPTKKLSKREGDASFEDLLNEGYLVDAIINYLALLGWSPADTREFFTLEELIDVFEIKGLSKSPSIFDIKKLKWMNAEYIRKMDEEQFHDLVKDKIKNSIQKDCNTRELARLLQHRIEILNDIPEMLDFVDRLPDYDPDIYLHKRMKSNYDSSLKGLEKILPALHELSDWTEESIREAIHHTVEKHELSIGKTMWAIRTALSGKATSPGGSVDLCLLLGKEESMDRIQHGIEKLKLEKTNAANN